MNVTLTPIIIPLFDLQAEFPDLDSEDSVGKETGKGITGTDIESQNQEVEAAAGDVLPVQIERRFNKLSALILHKENRNRLGFVQFIYLGIDHIHL
jgi:hypothetical protein